MMKNCQFVFTLNQNRVLDLENQVNLQIFPKLTEIKKKLIEHEDKINLHTIEIEERNFHNN